MDGKKILVFSCVASTILTGVTISNNVVVAAGAVVTKDVPGFLPALHAIERKVF